MSEWSWWNLLQSGGSQKNQEWYTTTNKKKKDTNNKINESTKTVTTRITTGMKTLKCHQIKLSFWQERELLPFVIVVKAWDFAETNSAILTSNVGWCIFPFFCEQWQHLLHFIFTSDTFKKQQNACTIGVKEWWSHTLTTTTNELVPIEMPVDVLYLFVELLLSYNYGGIVVRIVDSKLWEHFCNKADHLAMLKKKIVLLNQQELYEPLGVVMEFSSSGKPFF